MSAKRWMVEEAHGAVEAALDALRRASVRPVEDHVADALIYLGSAQVMLAVAYPEQYREAAEALRDLVRALDEAGVELPVPIVG